MALRPDLSMGPDSGGALNMYVLYVDRHCDQTPTRIYLVLSLWLQVWGHVALESRSVATDRPSWRDLT